MRVVLVTMLEGATTGSQLFMVACHKCHVGSVHALLEVGCCKERQLPQKKKNCQCSGQPTHGRELKDLEEVKVVEVVAA